MRKKWRNYITHRINPVHIYCRLCDIGLPRTFARKLATRLQAYLMLTTDGAASYRI
jgi:hypothetical protein